MFTRISIISSFFMLLVFCAEGRDRMAYIKQYEHIAIFEMERAGVPASIKMAQAILESADGTSYLATAGNNHFGIKCGSKWTGKTVHLKDDDYKNGQLIKSCFRKYNSSHESFEAHSDFLRNNQRYSQLFTYKKTDYRRWARGLKQAGYATNPSYANILIGIIERNSLHHLDKMNSPTPPLASAETEPSVKPSKKPTKAKKPSKKPSKQNTASKSSTIVFNDVKMVKIGSQDSYQSIAKKHKISLSKLLKYNDLPRPIPLYSGDQVYLQPKRGSYRGKRQWHKVAVGETMHSISQRYGIKLSSLYKKNLMTGKQQPEAGTQIALRKKAKKAPNLQGSSTPIVRPSTSSSHSKPAIGKTATPATKYHRVSDSDTLWSISNQYGVSVDHLKTLNGLQDSTIMKGQRLRIR